MDPMNLTPRSVFPQICGSVEVGLSRLTTAILYILVVFKKHMMNKT